MKIKYSKKETRNLGNYENVTVEISVEDTVDFQNETKEECFTRLREFVITRLPFQFNKTEDVYVPETKESDNKNTLISSIEPDIELIKNKMVNLIEQDKNNRTLIKELLREYNAEKLQELTNEQLFEFNIKLLTL
jgi:hypothetical protein